MRNLNFKTLIFFAALMLFPLAFANAQGLDERPQERPNMRPQRLFEQLGLSREQIQQIRRINREKQPLMREAQERLREANRALDMAIYADTVNEEDIKNRLADVQKAQAEVARIRAMTEFAVRKVLTPEQLAKFRQLREEFMRRMEERRMENQDRENQPRNEQNLQRRRNNQQNF